MQYTTQQKIDIANISHFLCLKKIAQSGLYGSGIDLLLPEKIFTIKRNLEFLYKNSPTDLSIIKLGECLLSLCSPYVLSAFNILNSGSGGGVSITPTAPVGYEYFSEVFVVTATNENNNTGTDAPYDGATVWSNPYFIGAKQLSYLIIDNTIETEGNGFVFDDALGTITSGAQRFTGSVISISFMKKI